MSQSSNFIIITAARDLTTLEHWKSKTIIKEISSNIESIESSEIDKYISQNQSIPIYFNIDDSNVKLTTKSIQDSKIAKKYIKSDHFTSDSVASKTSTFINKSNNAATIVKIKLEEKSAKKNLNNANIIAAKYNNKIISVGYIPELANHYIRQICKIDKNSVNGFIVTNNNYAKSVIATENDIIYIKSFNAGDQAELQSTIQDEILNMESFLETNSKYQEYDLKSSFKNIYILADTAGYLFSKPSEKTNCIIITNYLNQNNHSNISAFISKNAISYPEQKILNTKIKTKRSIQKFYKISKTIFMCGTIFLVSISGKLLNGYISAIEQKKNAMQKMKEIERMLPDNPTKIYLTNIQEADNIINFVNLEETGFYWQDRATKIANIVNQFKQIQITRYQASCEEDCKIKNIEFSIDIGNPSGYIHKIHATITNLKKAIELELQGTEYHLEGLNFGYMYNISRQYFAGNITFKITNGKNDDKQKELIETLLNSK